MAAATLASDGMGTGSPARGGRASSPAVAAPRETAAVVYFGGSTHSRSLTETLWVGLCRRGILLSTRPYLSRQGQIGSIDSNFSRGVQRRPAALGARLEAARCDHVGRADVGPCGHALYPFAQAV
eukprot:COSAG06_NODE_1444_length_9453_cov_2.850438_8_plen_125_part_00